MGVYSYTSLVQVYLPYIFVCTHAVASLMFTFNYKLSFGIIRNSLQQSTIDSTTMQAVTCNLIK